MERERFIEKSTGDFWFNNSMYVIGNTEYHKMCRMNDGYEIEITKEEMNSRFEYKPWSRPIRDVEKVEPRHPIHIVLRCPECGSPLETEGGAYLTSPLKYEHICSNKDCKYEACISSIYSGMYAAVTDEQEEKIKNGTFDERVDGIIIELKEKDLWEFKKE